MQRVYHGFEKWEDYKFGMYETTCFMDSHSLIVECESLLSCPEWLYECMVFVMMNWKHSAEQNLTNTHRNRQAWLGQAACCFIHGAPEYITKIAWNNLTKQQQDMANDVADTVISMFEDRFSRGLYSCQKLH